MKYNEKLLANWIYNSENWVETFYNYNFIKCFALKNINCSNYPVSYLSCIYRYTNKFIPDDIIF